MWWWLGGTFIVVIAWISLWRPVKAAAREIQFAKARKFFHRQRERLEAKFVHLASTKAKSDSPKMSDCMFADDVSYVRNRATGELSAFVAVSIPVENTTVSTYKNSDTVGNLQLGTAVFRFDRDHWETDGRTILNLNPSEAIKFFRKDIEMIGEELAHRAQ